MNGCSRAIRISVPSGSSSQGRFSASTKPKCGVLCAPEYSSDKMTRTTAVMLPHQTSAGTLIHSLARTIA